MGKKKTDTLNEKNWLEQQQLCVAIESGLKMCIWIHQITYKKRKKNCRRGKLLGAQKQAPLTTKIRENRPIQVCPTRPVLKCVFRHPKQRIKEYMKLSMRKFLGAKKQTPLKNKIRENCPFQVCPLRPVLKRIFGHHKHFLTLFNKTF